MDPNATDPASTTLDPSGNQGNNPQNTGENWEARFKGLQTSYNNLKASTDKTILKLTNDLSDLQSKYEEQSINFAAVQKSVTESTEKVTATSAEKEKLQNDFLTASKRYDRMKFIVSNYPELASLEISGGLPDATDDEDLKVKLDAQITTLNSLVEKRLKDHLNGSTGNGSGANTNGTDPAHNQQKRTKEAVWSELAKYRGSNDPQSQKRYEELEQEWESLFE